MIKGETIQLRAIEYTDLQQLLNWRNLPQLRNNFREYRELNLENQQHWFNSLQNRHDILMFFIETTDTGRPIGVCGLTAIDWRVQCAEFSLYIGDKKLYIDGIYAPDATGVLLRYAFNELHLHKIWAEVYEFDHLKANMLQNTFGFSKDGTLRDSHFTNGNYCNSIIFSLLRHEWQI